MASIKYQAAYFQGGGLLGDVSFDGRDETDIDAVYDAWQALPATERATVDGDLSEIDTLATGDCVTTFVQEAKYLGVTLGEEFSRGGGYHDKHLGSSFMNALSSSAFGSSQARTITPRSTGSSAMTFPKCEFPQTTAPLQRWHRRCATTSRRPRAEAMSVRWSEKVACTSSATSKITVAQTSASARTTSLCARRGGPRLGRLSRSALPARPRCLLRGARHNSPRAHETLLPRRLRL